MTTSSAATHVVVSRGRHCLSSSTATTSTMPISPAQRIVTAAAHSSSSSTTRHDLLLPSAICIATRIDARRRQAERPIR